MKWSIRTWKKKFYTTIVLLPVNIHHSFAHKVNEQNTFRNFSQVLLHIFTESKACSPYSCNYRHKRVPNSVPSNFGTNKHFDYNIASFTSVVINCSVSSSCNDHTILNLSTAYATLNQTDMVKQLLMLFETHCTHEFFIENYGYDLPNLIGTVGKVELISTFTIAVCECWNVINKYTWNIAGDLKQLSIDQTRSEDDMRD